MFINNKFKAKKIYLIFTLKLTYKYSVITY